MAVVGQDNALIKHCVEYPTIFSAATIIIKIDELLGEVICVFLYWLPPVSEIKLIKDCCV